MNQFELVAREYFNFWGNKNIKGLSSIFENEIFLQDWESTIKGKENVLDFNLKFFDSIQTIDYKVLSIASHKNIVFSELEINIDGNKIFVIDKITFDDYFKIKSIRAYKG